MRFGTFLVGLRSYPRVRPHDLGIQIDITSGFLFRQGPWGDGIMRGAKIDNILSGKNTWPFSGPGERSRGIETRDLHETAVRTWWDHSRGPKPAILGHVGPKLPVCRVSGPKIITY